MKTMKWLIKREIWENKGMLVWTPLAVAAAVALLALASLFLGKVSDMQVDGHGVGSITIEGAMRTRVAETLAQAYIGAGMPVVMLLGLLVFFYCLNALHDERRDRSLLFWKSLPVSDLSTVLSKLLLAVVVAPLISMAIAIGLGLVILVATCAMLLAHGTNLVGAVLDTPELYLTPLRLIGLLPVYVLWALPTVGWLLMVSSMARSKVFLWAVGTPLIVSLLMLWAEKALSFGIDTAWFASHVTNRILLGVVPGAWFAFSRDSVSVAHGANQMALPDAIFEASWQTLGGPSVWLGAAAGVAMIAIAVYTRRRREEV